ncbi:hypothetical protein HDV03_001465 [Kappamyces sp. JEL0829]|nr:hypothetical protein HDV03_001465 [Kappamyces sp. JEL0829]
MNTILTQTFCKPSWDAKKDMQDQTGQVCIVTGANTGLGKITATELARKNAQVFCLGRSPDKCLAAVEEIKKETGNEKIHFIQMDLMDLESVEAAADSFLASNLPLHKLILNAGIMIPPFQLTKQGLESQLGVNHFAHVVLANKLFKKLEESQPSRVVVLSSIAHGNAPYDGIHYDDLNNKDAYNAQQRYGESKLANLHFAKALQNKFTARNKDSQVFVNAVHPGWLFGRADSWLGVVATELTRSMNSLSQWLWNATMISPYHGAMTQLYVATDPSIVEQKIRGEYWVPYGKVSSPTSAGANPEYALKTWTWTEEVLQKHFRPDWKWSL